MTRYAERTMVTSEKSRNEIESTLRRYGATSFAYGWTGDGAQIGFHLGNRAIRFHREWLRPQLDEAYSNNRMPALMAGVS